MFEVYDKISIGTTFNKRIFECRSEKLKTNLFFEMQKKFPEIPFFAYHENSFELEKYNEKIDFEDYERDNLHLYDLFDVNKDWIENFILKSPLKDCHKIENAEWKGHNNNNNNNYWNRNAIYWFRKIASIHHCVEQVKTPYLAWFGSDVNFKKPFDEKLIKFIDSHDSSLIIRDGCAIESDVCFFNLEKNGKEIIKHWVNMFLSFEIFKQSRWDDSWALEITKKQLENKYVFGKLTNGKKFNIHDYIYHPKGEHVNLRKQKDGI